MTYTYNVPCFVSLFPILPRPQYDLSRRPRVLQWRVPSRVRVERCGDEAPSTRPANCSAKSEAPAVPPDFVDDLHILSLAAASRARAPASRMEFERRRIPASPPTHIKVSRLLFMTGQMDAEIRERRSFKRVRRPSDGRS